MTMPEESERYQIPTHILRDKPFFRFSGLNGPVHHDTAPNSLVR